MVSSLSGCSCCFYMWFKGDEIAKNDIFCWNDMFLKNEPHPFPEASKSRIYLAHYQGVLHRLGKTTHEQHAGDLVWESGPRKCPNSFRSRSNLPTQFNQFNEKLDIIQSSRASKYPRLSSPHSRWVLCFFCSSSALTWKRTFARCCVLAGSFVSERTSLSWAHSPVM